MKSEPEWPSFEVHESCVTRETQQSLSSKVCYDITHLFIYLFTLTYRMKWRHSALFEKLLSGASLQTAL